MATTSASTLLNNVRSGASADVPQRWVRSLLAIAGVSIIASLGLAFSSADGPRRLAHGWLLNGWLALSIGLGSLFFVAIQHVVRAGWSVVVRRIAELLGASITAPLLMLAPLLPLLMLGDSVLFPWNDAALVEGDTVLQKKSPYLNAPFFIARSALYAGIWISAARWYLSISRQQDDSQEKHLTLKLESRSAPILIALALTTTFAAFDWLMSLDPYWFSTIFGIYAFAGAQVAALAVLAIVTALLVQNQSTPAVTREHLHDVVKLLFGMNCFWAYIAFSQYLLIWYANIPEETVWLKHRQEYGWAGVTHSLVITHFVAPFLILMPRAAKRSPRLVVAMSLCLLLAHWLDLYWIVFPQLAKKPVFGFIEVTSAAAFLSVTTLFVLRRVHGRLILPIHDPRLEESVNHVVH